jgi:hypothetical protein
MINPSYHFLTRIPIATIPTELSFLNDGTGNANLINPKGPARSVMTDLGLMKNIHVDDINLGADVNGGWGAKSTEARLTKGEWTAQIGAYYMTYIANTDLASDSEAEALGIKYAVNIATKNNPEGLGPLGGLCNAQISLTEFSGQKIRLHISFYAKKLVETTTPVQVRTNISAHNTSLVRAWNASSFNTSTWTKIDDTFDYIVPSNADHISIYAIGNIGGSYSIAQFNFMMVGTYDEEGNFYAESKSNVNWSNVLGSLALLTIYPEWESKIAKSYKEKTYIPGMFPISMSNGEMIVPMDLDSIVSSIYDSVYCRQLLLKANLESAFLESDTASEKIVVLLLALAKYNQS